MDETDTRLSREETKYLIRLLTRSRLTLILYYSVCIRYSKRKEKREKKSSLPVVKDDPSSFRDDQYSYEIETTGKNLDEGKQD